MLLWRVTTSHMRKQVKTIKFLSINRVHKPGAMC